MWVHLVSRWGYVAVVLGSFVEGEGVLLSAGALAHVGLLSLPLVVLAGAFGSLVWGQAWFLLGASFGRRFLEQRPKLRARSLVVERWVAVYGGWLVLAFRFIAGAAVVLPVLFGASGFRRQRFLLLDGAGALTWSAAFACAGFGVGAALQKLQGRAVDLLESVAIALGGGLLIFFVTCLLRASLARPAAEPRSP